MAGATKPIIHGGDHGPGGADPLRSSGQAAGEAIIADGNGGIGWGNSPGPKHVLAVWGGTIPSTTGNGQVWRVPTAADGSSYTFTLYRAFARLEDTASGDVVFRLEKSTGSGAFSPTTITTITVTAGTRETVVTGLSGTVSSDDKLRLVFVDVDAAADIIYSAELIGRE